MTLEERKLVNKELEAAYKSGLRDGRRIAYKEILEKRLAAEFEILGKESSCKEQISY